MKMNNATQYMQSISQTIQYNAKYKTIQVILQASNQRSNQYVYTQKSIMLDLT